MSTKKPTARASDPTQGDLARRRFLQGSLGLGLGLGLGWLRPSPAGAVPPAPLAQLLETSPFVYVCPLRRDGTESRCHGEVWYGWLDGDVVLVTARSTWKGRALARGLDRARIWVGDHGIWKRWWGRDESFREAPSFVATARAVREDALMERLMTLYAEKYPEEFSDWEQPMRRGYASGERLLIRYSGSF